MDRTESGPFGLRRRRPCFTNTSSQQHLLLNFIMAPVIEMRPWDEFTDISKYGLPSDVQSILDRLQQNVQRYLGNYLIFAGMHFHSTLT